LKTSRSLFAILLLSCSSGNPSPGESPTPPGDDPSLDLPLEPYARPAYTTLSETGLFAEVATRTLARGVEEFEPMALLWADGADKKRWMKLGPGKIDNSDMDHWVFPIGTRFWKQFSLPDGELETRLIERYGDGREDYFMGSFVFRADGSDADLVPDGREDLLGTSHDAPSEKQCWSCHNGERGRILGFSALQLPSETGLPDRPSLESLERRELLTDAPELDAESLLRGEPALAYLHANCGHCHNLSGTAWPDTQMVLRLRVEETDAPASDLYRSIVDQPIQYFRAPEGSLRVAPGNPENSVLLSRMKERTTKQRMPPLGTEAIDEAGVELVRAWIAGLEPSD
jgi:hypothetical protein